MSVFTDAQKAIERGLLIRRAVIRLTRVNPEARLLLGLIENCGGTYEGCCLSDSELAELSGTSERSVKNGLNQLSRTGLLTTKADPERRLFSHWGLGRPWPTDADIEEASVK